MPGQPHGLNRQPLRDGGRYRVSASTTFTQGAPNQPYRSQAFNPTAPSFHPAQPPQSHSPSPAIVPLSSVGRSATAPANFTYNTSTIDYSRSFPNRVTGPALGLPTPGARVSRTPSPLSQRAPSPPVQQPRRSRTLPFTFAPTSLTSAFSNPVMGFSVPVAAPSRPASRAISVASRNGSVRHLPASLFGSQDERVASSASYQQPGTAEGWSYDSTGVTSISAPGTANPYLPRGLLEDRSRPLSATAQMAVQAHADEQLRQAREKYRRSNERF